MLERYVVVTSAIYKRASLLFRTITKAWKTMTEESNKEVAPPEKLLIDNPADFRFHAAYIAYSNAYDKTANPETKRQLNQNITALQQNQIDYSTFYKNISQYRAEEGGFQHGYGKTLIRTQKKREWHRKMQKRERNKRHKR